MTGIWRVVLFFYSLLLVAASVSALILAIGRTEILDSISIAVSSSEARLIVAGIALLLLVLSVITLFYSIGSNSAPKSKTILVNSGVAGQVSMTIPAVKVIVMKAVKTVEGIRDIRTTISNKPEGVDVLLHTMINPEYNIPEMSEKIQTVVRQQLEDVGGLKVAGVRVLVDDFGSAAKAPGN